MSFWDSESRLAQHLCHSFVVSDDTGYADRIFLDNEDLIDESDQSYHINQRNITGFGSFSLNHTHSIIKMELDRTVIDIAKDVQMHSLHNEKIVKLLNQGIPAVASSLVFTKKRISKFKTNISLLSQQLSTISHTDIPFSQFAKFDGRNSNDKRSLSVTIIFEDTTQILKVLARINIRVFELIGLSLYLYNDQKLGKPLGGSVEQYKLYIADENGEIDKDFPPLCESDFFQKFGFSHLGLLRVEVPSDLLNSEDLPKECVLIRYKLGDYPIEEKKITMPRPSNQMQIIEVLSLALNKKGLTPSEEYILSESSDHCPIAHTSYLMNFPKKIFWLLKQDRTAELDRFSRRDQSGGYFGSNIPQIFDPFEAHWLNKKGEPLTQITISDTQITFKPLSLDHKQNQKTKFKLHLTLPKVEVLSTSSVQKCELSSRSPSMQGSKIFCILATKGLDRKIYEFEAESKISYKLIANLTKVCPNLVQD